MRMDAPKPPTLPVKLFTPKNAADMPSCIVDKNIEQIRLHIEKLQKTKMFKKNLIYNLSCLEQLLQHSRHDTNIVAYMEENGVVEVLSNCSREWSKMTPVEGEIEVDGLTDCMEKVNRILHNISEARVLATGRRLPRQSSLSRNQLKLFESDNQKCSKTSEINSLKLINGLESKKTTPNNNDDLKSLDPQLSELKLSENLQRELSSSVPETNSDEGDINTEQIKPIINNLINDTKEKNKSVMKKPLIMNDVRGNSNDRKDGCRQPLLVTTTTTTTTTPISIIPFSPKSAVAVAITPKKTKLSPLNSQQQQQQQQQVTTPGLKSKLRPPQPSPANTTTTPNNNSIFRGSFRTPSPKLSQSTLPSTTTTTSTSGSTKSSFSSASSPLSSVKAIRNRLPSTSSTSSSSSSSVTRSTHASPSPSPSPNTSGKMTPPVPAPAPAPVHLSSSPALRKPLSNCIVMNPVSAAVAVAVDTSIIRTLRGGGGGGMVKTTASCENGIQDTNTNITTTASSSSSSGISSATMKVLTRTASAGDVKIRKAIRGGGGSTKRRSSMIDNVNGAGAGTGDGTNSMNIVNMSFESL